MKRAERYTPARRDEPVESTTRDAPVGRRIALFPGCLLAVTRLIINRMNDHELEELLPRVRAGDSDALTCLLYHYQPILRRALEKRFGAASDGAFDLDDVLQKAFVSAFEGLPDARPACLAEFYAWLERIAENDLRDALRANRRQKRDVRRQVSVDARGSIAALVRRLAGDDPTPSRQAAKLEAAAALHACLARLTADQRRVIRARYFENVPVADLARELGKTDQAIHALCYRALRALRGHLGSLTKYLSRL